MSRRTPAIARALLAAAAAWAAASARVVDAEVDSVQAALQRQQAPPVYWENVKGAPWWISGQAPGPAGRVSNGGAFTGLVQRVAAWFDLAGTYVVRLAPGEETVVLVPAGERLRLCCPNETLPPDAVSVAVSNGSGLFLEIPAVPSEDDHSLLAAADGFGPSLVRVRRPDTASAPLTVALFVSRRTLIGPISPYRDLVPLDTDPIRSWLARTARGNAAPAAGGAAAAPSAEDPKLSGRLAEGPVWRMAPGTPVRARVTGPARFAVKHRRLYAVEDAARRQEYRIEVRLNGVPHAELHFVTRPETRSVVVLGGETPVFGLPETAYIEVPKGAFVLELEPTCVLYGQLWKQPGHDYLLPRANEPVPSATQVRAAGFSPLEAKWVWDVTAQEVQAAVEDTTRVPVDTERVAARLARDNERQGGGLLAAMAMRDAALKHPDLPEVQQAAEGLLTDATFYRDVSPANKADPRTQVFSWTTARRLREPDERVRDIVTGSQHDRESLNFLASGYFIELPAANAGTPLEYRFPPRCGPSLMRVMALPDAADARQRFALQFDDLPPLQLAADTRGLLAPGAYWPSLGEVGLQQLRCTFGLGGPVTLSGPFSALRTPARMAYAGAYELPLPEDVRRLKAWRTAPGGEIRLAVQYRAARTFQLSEGAFLDAVSQLPSCTAAYELLTRAIAGEAPEEGSSQAENDLLSHWLPLVRFLKSMETTFIETVSPHVWQPASLSGLGEGHATAAADAAKDGDWLAALEGWTKVMREASGPLRVEALQGAALALEELGEVHLAGRLVRGTFLFSEEPALRDAAFQHLLERVLADGNPEDLLELRAVAALREPAAERLAALADALTLNEEYEMALTAGLVLPEDRQPLDALIRAAYALGWWRVFDGMAARLTDDASRQLWLGLRACERGGYEAAVGLLASGGGEGQAFGQALEWGYRIASLLSSADPAARERGIVEWESWEANHPGRRVWRGVEEWVTDYVGAETVYSVSRDAYGRAYRAEPLRPVRIRFAGPLRLRIEARPLLAADVDEPVDGWIRIEEEGCLRVLPFTNCVRSGGLELVDSPWSPGVKTAGEYDFGPGLHEVVVSSPGGPILVQAFREEPEVRLGVLPQLNFDTLCCAYLGGYAAHGPSAPAAETTKGDGNEKCDYNLVVVESASQRTGETDSTRCAVYPWRLEDASPDCAGFEPAPGELRALMARLAALRGPAGSACPEETEGRHLAAGDWEAALALPMGEAAADVLRRMTLLLWIAEQYPDQQLQALVRAEALAQDYPKVPGVQQALSRLSRDADWAPVEDVNGGLGLRRVEVAGWNPEHPALRARKAILEPLAPEDLVLTGDADVVLVLGNLEPTTIDVAFTMICPDYLCAGPMTATYQVNDGPMERVSLELGQAEELVTRVLPAGEHAVRFGIADPLANQFVVARMWETPAGGTRVPLVRSVERVYHVATPEEPVHVTLKGPAWVRVDELRGNSTISTCREVEAGWHEFDLAPEPAQPEALLRVYRRVVTPGKRSSPVWRVTLPREPVPPPAVHLAVAPASPALEAGNADAVLPGSGTWSVHNTWARRIGAQEDETGDWPLQEHVELSVRHRRWNEDQSRHFNTELLLREREFGAPTAGLRGQIALYPQDSRMSYFLDGEAYVQTPESELHGGTEWAVSLEGRMEKQFDLGPKAYHVPYLALFVRELSMDTNTVETRRWQRELYRRLRNGAASAIDNFNVLGDAFQFWPLNDLFSTVVKTEVTAAMDREYREYLRRTVYDPRALDRDVFTTYKADHKGGFRVGDTLVYRPWLDTEWYGGAYLTSNDTLDPTDLDQMGLRAGWRQLIGNVQVNAQYRYRRYFDDGKRADAIDRNYIDVEALWDRWFTEKNRLEIGLTLTGDLDKKDIEAVLQCSWCFGHDKAYRTFRPGEIDFRDVRTRRATHRKETER